MIKLKVILVIILLALMSGVFAEPCIQWEEDPTGFATLAKQLTEAIEARNFSDARQTIEQLLPLMKKELKEHKRMLSEFQKSAKPDLDAQESERKLLRKNEIYEDLKMLAEGSVAALRAKSDQIKSDVEAFVSLTMES